MSMRPQSPQHANVNGRTLVLEWGDTGYVDYFPETLFAEERHGQLQRHRWRAGDRERDAEFILYRHRASATLRFPDSPVNKQNGVITGTMAIAFFDDADPEVRFSDPAGGHHQPVYAKWIPGITGHEN
jgi:hypothetical protein